MMSGYVAEGRTFNEPTSASENDTRRTLYKQRSSKAQGASARARNQRSGRFYGDHEPARTPNVSSHDEKPKTTSEPPACDHEVPSSSERVKVYLIKSLYWVLSFVGTVLNNLMVPLATLVSIGVFFYILATLWSAFTSQLCGLPIISRLEVCAIVPPPPPPPPPRVNPFVQKNLDHSEILGEVARVGVDSVELPYHLRHGEGGVRGMILQLSAIDLPSKKLLMPLLQEYRHVTDQSIDGLQDMLAHIDKVIDRTIVDNSWAEAQLERIEERESSVMGQLSRLLSNILPSSISRTTSMEDELRKQFRGLNQQMQTQTTNVIIEAQKLRGNMVQLKNILEEIALIALGDENLLERDKLGQKSYWKWILRSYRDKMADFDAKISMCAEFYRHTQRAISVVDMTDLKLTAMRSQMKVFQDSLSETPLTLGDGKKVPLRLYIDTLKAGVEKLENMRKSAKLLKEERMKRLERKKGQKGPGRKGFL